MWLKGRSVPARGLKVVIQINVVITVSSGESNCDCVPVLLSTVSTVIEEKSWHSYNLSRQLKRGEKKLLYYCVRDKKPSNIRDILKLL